MVYEGPWVMVHKPPSSKERIAEGVQPRTLIHDDDAARARGYKEGIVGGLSLLSVTTGAIAASLGQRWYEGGTYSVRHRNVSYQGEVRVVWELVTPDPPDDRKVTFHIENKEGETSTYGWASTVEPGQKTVPPWERSSVPHKSVGDDAAPEMVVGTARPSYEIIVHPENVMEKQENWWYRVASPWGDPVLSPFDIVAAFYHGRRINPASVEGTASTRLVSGMDAGTDLMVHEPVFLNRTYIIRTEVADKWQTAQTVFFSNQSTYEDKETGRLVATMRRYSAHIIRDLALASVTD